MNRSPRDINRSGTLALLTASQMGKADAAAIAAGTPGVGLMAAAGNVVVEAIVNRFSPRPTLVLAGPGNNGGDGYVVAEKLRRLGWPVELRSLVPRAALKGDAAWAASLYSGAFSLLTSIDDLQDNALVVDGLFGAGLSRPVEGKSLDAIKAINNRRLVCVAIDMPSGIHADSGQVLGAAPSCALTVTFFRAKPGHLLLPGRLHCGELLIGDIGIPPHVLDDIQPTVFRNGPGLFGEAWQRPNISDHKYTRGAVLILAGAGMTGAARLAAAAARRIGAGLVSVGSPDRATAAVLRAGEPGVIVREEALAHLLADRRLGGVLLGPGGGLSQALRDDVIATLRTGVPTVLDADALTIFGDRPTDLFDAISGPCLLTPHEGEFQRLFNEVTGDSNKLNKVREAAKLSGATVLLKGPDTVISNPSGTAVINDNAPPSLATAGSGDVLAGFAVGLLAQGLTPLVAGAVAAWTHGALASRAGNRLIAEDLLVIDFAHIGL